MFLSITPWLIAMVVLIFASAFFSASEAALFSLRAGDRIALRNGRRGQRVAAELLDDPDRLLSAVLFCNLVVNLLYFAISSVAALKLQEKQAGQMTVVAFSIGSLIAIIFFSEMLPKSVAVVAARRASALLAIPLSACVRLLDPVVPFLSLVGLLSRRLIWPRLKPEAYLEVSDLERAIQLSTNREQLVDQEQTVLSNIVSMTELRVDECMRPRTQLETFKPPVSRNDLAGDMTPSGYLFVTEVDSEEIASAIRLQGVAELPEEHLERYAEPVEYVPWCISMADAWEQMLEKERETVAVVNEWGETIGALTRDDVFDTIFTDQPGRIERLLNREAIRKVAPGLWQVTGMINLRRLARYFQVNLPPSQSVTVAGMIQEILERVPVDEDTGELGPFTFVVVRAGDPDEMLVNLKWIDPKRQHANGAAE